MLSHQNSVCIPLQTRDGHRFDLHYCKASREEAPVVLIFPALGVRAAYYEPLVQTLCSAGFHTARFDHRGTGSSSVKPKRGVDFGYETILNEDYPVLFKGIREVFPGQPLFLLGHSLGAQLSMIYVAKQRVKVHGLIHIGAGTPWYNNWQGRERLKLITASLLFPLICRVFGYFPGQRLGFAGRQPKTLMMDWSATVRTGNYQPHGTRKAYESAMVRTEKPILSISLAGDFYAPPKAAEHLSLKYGPASDVVHLHYAGDRLPHPQIDHFNWVKSADFLLPALQQWVQTHIAHPVNSI